MWDKEEEKKTINLETLDEWNTLSARAGVSSSVMDLQSWDAWGME